MVPTASHYTINSDSKQLRFGGDDDAYVITANRLIELAAQQDGSLGVKSVRDSQSLGRSRWYDYSKVVVRTSIVAGSAYNAPTRSVDPNTPQVKPGMIEIIKIARPGFWPTHVWFYLLPFAGRDMFGSLPFWIGCLYVTFPLGLLLYGWNDVGDYISDRCNPRKDSWLFGARPDEAMRHRLPWIIAAVQVPFVIAFVWLGGPKMVLWFIAVVLSNATYNTLGFKRLPALDLLNQIGYLLIFLLGSWLCDVPQLNGPAMIFSALFAMQSHLFGQLMDIEEDRLAERRSTAITIGTVPAKWLLVAIMCAEVAISWNWFRSPYVAYFMLLGVLFFSLDAMAGPQRYPARFTKLFFVAWNVIVIATMHFIWRWGVFLVH